MVELWNTVKEVNLKNLTDYSFIIEHEEEINKFRLGVKNNRQKDIVYTQKFNKRLSELDNDQEEVFLNKLSNKFDFTEEEYKKFLQDKTILNISDIFEEINYIPSEQIEKAIKKELEQIDIDTTDKYIFKKLPGRITNKIQKYLDCITIEETDQILIYSDGLYNEYGEQYLKRLIQKGINHDHTNKHLCEEVIGHIQRSTYHPREDFDKDPNIINLKNGLLDITTGEVKPHTPEYLSRIQLPVEYKPNIKSKLILKFLSEVMPDSQQKRLLLEELASCLWRSAALQKGFIHNGKGNNGKSQWFNIIVNFLGKKNVSHASLQELAVDKFAPADIDGKLANIFADITDDEIKKTGKVKAIITGDPIRIQRKGKDGYNIIPFAKCIFSANEFPEPNDDSDAWYRRWIIHDWEKQFKGDENIKDIGNKISTPEELSGLLNIIIPLTKKLINGGDFTEPPTTEQVRSEWGEKTDLLKRYSTHYLKEEEGGFVVKADLYKHYVKWCLDQDFQPVSNQSFYNKLSSKLPMKSTTKRVSGKVTRVMDGVSWKNVTGVTGVTPSVHQQNVGSTLGEYEKLVTPVTGVTLSQDKEAGSHGKNLFSPKYLNNSVLKVFKSFIFKMSKVDQDDGFKHMNGSNLPDSELKDE